MVTRLCLPKTGLIVSVECRRLLHLFVGTRPCPGIQSCRRRSGELRRGRQGKQRSPAGSPHVVGYSRRSYCVTRSRGRRQTFQVNAEATSRSPLYLLRSTSVDDPETQARALSNLIAHSQPLDGAFDAILSHILVASELATATFRTKALRALGLIVEQDPNIFFQTSVRRTIENRLLDSSPAVRDAALDMLGKYVVINPQLAVECLPRILDRINVRTCFCVSVHVV
jgi:hypothetical protein